ncbi:MAG: phenylalanine--tRNA ligase subunit beta [Candidatus Aenigmarchaeota archaeon]|nr:phenylalanine--tRNA ligase subunit beta [Candidatus Aenigmarchaeota archaeon]
MPVIKVNKQDFCKLVGKDLDWDVIEKKLPMLGVGWEGRSEEEFEVEVFPNRPDMLSVEGLARAFSSFIGVRKGLKHYDAKPSQLYIVSVDEKVSKVRPFIACTIAMNVEFTDDFIRSIMQVQEKLHVTHGRKRRKVAIGLHDFDKIKFPVYYTTKPKEFKFIPLGESKEMSLEEILQKHPKGVEYGWIVKDFEEYPILIDAKGMVLSMPPIINSIHTMLTESTRNVFFDMTGTDWKAVNEVLNILVTTFIDRGAEVFRVRIKYPDRFVETPDLSPKEMRVEYEYINRLLGLSLSKNEIHQLLGRMGYDAYDDGSYARVLVPCYRTDIMHPIDVVEDVAIAYGYDRFEPELPNLATIGQEDEFERFSTKLRNFMVGYGLQEVKTFILTSKKKLFEKMRMEEQDVVEAENPKTEEFNVVRNLLLPSLMEVLSRNVRRAYPQNIYEIGDVVLLDENSDTGTRIVRKACVALCHSKASFSEIKSLTESLLRNVGVKEFEFVETSKNFLIEGRGACVKVKDVELGFLGEVHPAVLEEWKIEMPVSVLEMDVNKLFEVAKQS